MTARKLCWWKTAGCCLILVVTAHAQVPLTVGFQKRIQIAVSGATAAYSLNSTVAEASAAAGTVEIDGRSPGATNIVVVTADGVRTLAVVVPAPVPVLPPGFEATRLEGATGESGAYELSYYSDPGQVTNSLDMKRSQGDSFERLRLVNANLFSTGSSQSSVGFPLLSYEISKPRRDVTFLDQQVENSPLTLDNYLVRGLHLSEGPWQFHGGFASVATFQGLFLATDREYVAGLSRAFVLDRDAAFEANLYYYRNPAGMLLASSNGAMGSLLYRVRRGDRFHFLAELGASRGLAFAVRDTYDTDRTHFHGRFRVESRNFASLAVNDQHGTFTALDATRKLGPRLYEALDFSQSAFNLALLQQKTLSFADQVNFKLNQHFSFTSGVNYSSFSSTVPATSGTSTATLPVGVDYSARHFGSSFGYQRAINFDGTGGNDYTVGLRAGAGEFQAGAFFRHDVQVPTLATVFSQIPALQEAIERAGIAVTTPDELAALLNNAALLASLGFTAPLVVNLAPARNDLEASLSWVSRGRARRAANLSYLKSSTELIQGKQVFTSVTLSYSQRLTANDNIVGSLSTLHSNVNGSVANHPLLTVSLQHRFFRVPGLLFPGRHGMIEGHVFRDDDANSTYIGHDGLGGVEVKLDDDHVTHTNSEGYYSFHHVPYGAHRVEARYESAEPFFYTTDSPAVADINSTIDFGINFARGQLYGFVRNDAGTGINGITVELRRVGAGGRIQAEKPAAAGTGGKPGEAPAAGEGAASSVSPSPAPREQEVEPQGPRQTQTSDSGKFSFAGLAPGNYIVSTVAGSYPVGYSLQDLALAPRTVSVLPGKPGNLEITVKALRSLSGKVTVYDQKTRQSIALSGASIRLKELGLETRSGDNGAYIFRNLPSGTYTLVVSYQGQEIPRSVVLPAGPANLRNMDLNAGTR